MKDWHEHIDDYINGTLKGDQLIAFEKEVETNVSLRAAIENYEDARLISEGLLEVDMMETISKLKIENDDGGISNVEMGMSKEEEGMNKAKSASAFNLRFLLSAAAMVGIVVFAGWCMFGPKGNSLDKEKILAEYKKPMNLDSTKSVDTVGMSPFEKGMFLFKTNRFEESEKWLKIYLSEETDKKMRSKGHFWLGAAHIEQWEVEKAIEAWGKSEEEGVKKNLELLEVKKEK